MTSAFISPYRYYALPDLGDYSACVWLHRGTMELLCFVCFALIVGTSVFMFVLVGAT
jgi:hypothetical protein